MPPAMPKARSSRELPQSPRTSVQTHRSRSSQIQTLRRPIQRHLHHIIHRVQHRRIQPMRLTPEHPSRRSPQLPGINHGVEIPLRIPIRGNQPKPCRPTCREYGGNIPRPPHWHMKNTPSGRPHTFPIVRIHRLPREQHRPGPGRVSHPRHRPRVPGIGHPHQHGHQRRPTRQHSLDRPVHKRAHRHNPLRRHGFRQSGRCLLRHERDRHTGGRSRLQQVLIARSRGGRHEQLMHDPVPQRRPHRLRPLGQEPSGLLPSRPPHQGPSSNDPGCPFGERIDPGSWEARAQEAALPCVPALPRARSTSAVNAVGSLTASSARILRSTSTPATRRPSMKRL